MDLLFVIRHSSFVRNNLGAPLTDQPDTPRRRATDTRRITNTTTNPSTPLLEIGILTIGKPTLAMALSSVLLQEERRIRIHLVDTSPAPIIDRTEVQFALRLAADRQITCSYEHLHDDKRAFSLGRLALLETLKGPHVCF